MSKRAALAAVAVLTALSTAAVVDPASAVEPVAVSEPATRSQPATGVANGLIVTFRKGTPAARSDAAAQARVTGRVEERFAGGVDATVHRRMTDGSVVVDLAGLEGPEDLQAALDAVRADPSVAYAEPDLVALPTAVAPDDPEYPRQWDLFEPTGGMDVPPAWDVSTGAGVRVAVIDTGVTAHPDLAGQSVPGYDFISHSGYARDSDGRDPDPSDEGDWTTGALFECGLLGTVGARPSSWHGTHVAGTIAAATGNATGVAGIAHGAKLQHVRVLGRCGGTSSDIVDAITWASGGTVAGVPANPTPADVINMSLGGAGACPAAVQSAISGAVQRGTTVVIAAGNSDADAAGSFPANCTGDLTVAASNRAGGRSWYSNYGDTVDVTAPGGQMRRESDPAGTATTPEDGIRSTLNSGSTTPGSPSYAYYQGTSMAAPHVAGLAALVVAADPSATPARVKELITAHARPMPVSCPEGCGAGLADAAATLAAVSGGTGPTPDPTEGPAACATHASDTDVAIPNAGSPVSSSITVDCAGTASAASTVEVRIRHTYVGDLVVDLVAPDGTAYRLRDREGGSADDVDTSYVVDLAAEERAGTWTLRVQDTASRLLAPNSGSIDGWSLTL